VPRIRLYWHFAAEYGIIHNMNVKEEFLKAGAMLGVALGALCLQAAEVPTDVFLLIGQSNMAGRGAMVPELKVSTERMLKWDIIDGKGWVEAVEPINQDRPFAGANLASTFARTLADADKNVVIGLVPAAEGGMPLDTFMPPNGQFYKRAVERTKAALAKGGKLKGILWHQGCADSEQMATSTNYAARLTVMVNALRKEFGVPDCPFIAGELGRYLGVVQMPSGVIYAKNYKVVNAQLHEMAKSVKNMRVVSSEGLESNEDNLHFNTIALREFGKRYAAAYFEIVGKKK
jgi:hypothetical protein